MALPLGIFLGGVVVGIPVVTGIAEGVEQFNAVVACDSNDEIADEIDKGILVVRHGKVRPLAPASLRGMRLPPLAPSNLLQMRFPHGERSR
jgi:hypothetical protein